MHADQEVSACHKHTHACSITPFVAAPSSTVRIDAWPLHKAHNPILYLRNSNGNAFFVSQSPLLLLFLSPVLSAGTVMCLYEREINHHILNF